MTSRAPLTIVSIRTAIRLSLLTLCSIGSLHVAPLHAGVLFTFQEVGSDVVATTSGSIGTGWSSPVDSTEIGSGNSFLSATSIIGRSTAGGMRYYGGPSLFTLNNELSGVPTSPIQSGIATGDFFGYGSSANLYTPAGVNEGESFSPDTTITWANETFASLGLDTSLTETPLVLLTLNNNDTISANLAVVPEPTSAGLMASGVAAAGCFFWNRRRAARAASDRCDPLPG